MKTITYSYERMRRAGVLLNSVTASGCSNIRALAELADILDSGEVGEELDEEKKEDK